MGPLLLYVCSHTLKQSWDSVVLTLSSATGNNRDDKSARREQRQSKFAHTVKCAAECSHQCPLLLTVARPLPCQRLAVCRSACVYEGRLRPASINPQCHRCRASSIAQHSHGYSPSESTSQLWSWNLAARLPTLHMVHCRVKAASTARIASSCCCMVSRAEIASGQPAEMKPFPMISALRSCLSTMISSNAECQFPKVQL